MLLVITGAGASYDCAPGLTGPWRPPLARDMFAPGPDRTELINMYPQCRVIIEDLLHTRGKVPVEQELQRLLVEADAYPRRHSQIMATRFYLQSLFYRVSVNWGRETAGLTLYEWLVDKVEKWRLAKGERVAYVTFNYDTLLDEACADVLRATFQNVDDWIGRPARRSARIQEPRPWALYKLHGSWNWGQATETYVDAEDDVLASKSRMIEGAAELRMLKDYRVETNDVDILEPEADTLYLPCISIPVEEKSDFACPPSHRKQLEEWLPAVDRVLVIGWRASEKHFLKMLSAAVPAKEIGVQIVGSSVDGVSLTKANLEAAIPSGRWETFVEGFSGYRVGGALDELLSSTS